MLAKLTLFLLSAFLFIHPAAEAQQPPPSPANPTPSASTAPAPDRIRQMRTDLNQMESLMGNMQSEINFLRDQNLQILLNTNVRMWTILIRDLRRQLDDEEQRRSAREPSSPKPKSPNQNDH